MGASNKLTAAAISKIKERGLYGDGKGLWLQVSAFDTKAWIFRFMVANRARAMGLGAFPDVSLKEARERADAARKQIRDGIDPIEARRGQKMAAKVEAAKQTTFSKCVEEYLEAHRDVWKNSKHREQWESTLRTYAEPVIGKLPVDAVDTALVLKILRPIWNKKPETASRLRGRIERVLAWATVSEYRRGENPARWRGHLQEMLPAKGKVRKVEHHKALPYSDVPAFMEKVRGNVAMSARALEFTILNASRTNEVIGAQWSEIDMAAKLWTVPAVRMKMGKEHRVPLSDRSMDLLKSLPRERGSKFIFSGSKKGEPLSNMAMLEFLRGASGNGYTVHGFRSSFKDWTAETTNYPREIAEAALAHAVKDKVEAAYQRGDLLEKRRRLMRDWAKYCSTKPTAKSANVVSINEARA